VFDQAVDPFTLMEYGHNDREFNRIHKTSAPDGRSPFKE
jgi:hypothetical protein